MADVILPGRSPVEPVIDALVDYPISTRDTPEIALIELLFFAYRDFTSDPDAILESYGFGRAHHRVLHFVNRNPGMSVAQLLGILRITKQSLGRVLKQLIDTDFVEQRPGPRDRRQRLLYPTAAGRELALRLLEPQMRRVSEAIQALPEAQREAVQWFLEAMIDDRERAEVTDLIDR
ncbi:MAG: MarR family winged helix-turn-helix transcriptional regulator [Alphaproteobacteria bacterium]